jgi:hypothetical protein
LGALGSIFDFLEEDSQMKTSAHRVIVVVAAVSFAVSSVIGAERVMIAELFTRTT